MATTSPDSRIGADHGGADARRRRSSPDGARDVPAPGLPAGDRTFGVLANVVLTLWALLVILPLLWTFYSSFKNSREILLSPFSLPEKLNVDNFVNAWTEAGHRQVLREHADRRRRGSAAGDAARR